MHFNAKWTHSLAFRILLAYVVGTLLSIGLLVVLAWIAQERLPGMNMAERTQHLAQHLQFDATGHATGFSSTAEHPTWIYQSLWQETAYRVLDEDGQIVLQSPGAESWPSEGDVSRVASGRFDLQLAGISLEGATEQITHNGKTWFVQLAVSERLINFLHQEFAVPFIRLGVLALGLILLIAFAVCAHFSLKFSLRPLRDASRAAEQISTKSLSARLQVDHVPLEIAPLINSVNAALSRLEKGFRIQKDFLAQAARELKTPLTLIRAEAELMNCDEEVRKSLLAYISHLTRHVQQLLHLAEASEPLGYQFDEVNVLEIADDAASYLEKIAHDANVSIQTQCFCNRPYWHADRGAFFTLLKNLIENAVQHSPAGAEVSVTIDSSGFCVRDWGQGVDADQISLIFSRFWRGTHRRDSGAGLGLTICQEICETHGWEISAANANPGLLIKVKNNMTENGPRQSPVIAFDY